MSWKRRLTHEESLIVLDYVKNLNPKYAYRRQKKGTDYEIKLFFKEKRIKQAIADCRKEVDAEVKEELKKVAIDKAYVQSKLQLLAEFNINKFIELKNGAPYFNFKNATDEDWYCISEYTADRIIKGMDDDLHPCERVKIKANCKLKALELLGKTVGAYTEKMEHSGATTIIFDNDYKAD